MGLFDKLKDAAEGLADRAKDKVGEVTGVDADKLIDAAGSAAEAGRSAGEAADSLAEGRHRG